MWKKLILEDNYIEKIRNGFSTFIVICNNEVIIDENNFGVISLLKHFEVLKNCQNLVIYDKLIGKGASMIMAILSVESIYSKTITTTALSILNESSINISFENEVEKILNRDKSDLCPIEKIAKDINDVNELVLLLREFYIERGYLND